MVGWHHQLHGHESEQALGGGGGQGSLVTCNPQGSKESDMAERLNTKNNYINMFSFKYLRKCNRILFLFIMFNNDFGIGMEDTNIWLDQIRFLIYQINSKCSPPSLC